MALSDLERGRTRINASDLVVVAGAFEKPVAHFLPGQTTLEGELSAKELELIRYFRGIQNEAMENLLIKQAQQFADAAREAMLNARAREMDAFDTRTRKPKGKK